MKNDFNENTFLSDDCVDDHVDDEIKQYLSFEHPKNFFMFAGAGSGKTRSLVKALTFLKEERGNDYSIYSKQIAVITYTNAACDEISRRLQYNPIFAVSTIHSFLWDLIKNFQTDIKKWVINSLEKELLELKEEEKSKRSSEKRSKEIIRKTTRLERLPGVKIFTYNPNGENIGYDSLNHNEVIKMGSEFIKSELTMQKILISKYPVLLIDESQDTKKELIDAILAVCDRFRENFVVGMFGDTMQRIYTDGKENLSNCIPFTWEFPQKVMNHRSSKRIVELANSIRGNIDNQKQKARSDASEGIVRLFIIESSEEKDKTEKMVANIMHEITNDSDWRDETGYKSLILEHHMAAKRFGFSNLFSALDDSKKFDTALRDGSISELSFLSKVISPLVKAYQENNDFEISKIIRKFSAFLDKKSFIAEKENQISLLQKTEDAVVSLMKLWTDDNIPTCIDIFKSIAETGLFKLDSRIDYVLAEYQEGENSKITALRKALGVTFDEFGRYAAYVNGNTRFATHQGVKGLEFPRVMVIMDDADARGILFSYEKLFGVKAKTATDFKNEKEGKDTSILRTTRLFYVACTRAINSLAVVAYTENSSIVKQTAISAGWFKETEIEILRI